MLLCYRYECYRYIGIRVTEDGLKVHPQCPENSSSVRLRGIHCLDTSFDISYDCECEKEAILCAVDTLSVVMTRKSTYHVIIVSVKQGLGIDVPGQSGTAEQKRASNTRSFVYNESLKFSASILHQTDFFVIQVAQSL